MDYTYKRWSECDHRGETYYMKASIKRRTQQPLAHAVQRGTMLNNGDPIQIRALSRHFVIFGTRLSLGPNGTLTLVSHDFSPRSLGNTANFSIRTHDTSIKKIRNLCIWNII
jgi:hypothetical protein